MTIYGDIQHQRQFLLQDLGYYPIIPKSFGSCPSSKDFIKEYPDCEAVRVKEVDGEWKSCESKGKLMLPKAWFDKFTESEKFITTYPFEPNDQFLVGSKVYEIEGYEYYSLAEACKSEPGILYGCDSKYKEFLRRQSLKEGEEFVYVRLKDGEWQISNGSSSAKDKIMIVKSWLNNFMRSGKACRILPAYICLDEKERFPNEKTEVNVYGKRDVRRCVFDAQDISNLFEIPTLLRHITNKKKYKEYIHYRFFMVEKESGNNPITGVLPALKKYERKLFNIPGNHPHFLFFKERVCQALFVMGCQDSFYGATWKYQTKTGFGGETFGYDSKRGQTYDRCRR